MDKVKINSQLSDELIFPKYTKQIINLANSNAKATSPNQVGNVSVLVNEFNNSDKPKTLENWQEFYENEMGTEIYEQAAKKILEHVGNLKSAIDKINLEMITTWVKDLIINKSFSGINFQYLIIEDLANKLDLDFRIATKEEEAHNIDGFINDKPVQVKSETFKNAGSPAKVQNFDCLMIYYNKKDNKSLEYEYNKEFNFNE